MHAGAFAFYLFSLAVANVAYTIVLILRSKKDYETANLINEIGVMTYFTASFIS
jgi:hypothetical protein